MVYRDIKTSGDGKSVHWRGVYGQDAGPVKIGGEIAECPQGDSLGEGAKGDPGYPEFLQVCSRQSPGRADH